MTCAVRYFSRSGNTKSVAEAIAKELGVEAISIDAPNGKITEDVDLLFIGGAIYAYGLDKTLVSYLESLDGNKVGKIAAFSTAWLTSHGIDVINKNAKAKGIATSNETLFIKSKAVENSADKIKAFVESVTR